MVDPGGITPLFRALGRSDLKCLFFHFPALVIACDCMCVFFAFCWFCGGVLVVVVWFVVFSLLVIPTLNLHLFSPLKKAHTPPNLNYTETILNMLLL